MKILFTADWHIKLNSKLPKEWISARYFKLVEEINNTECDLLIIGGDIFDNAKPNTEEIALYYDLVAKLKHKTLIYSGNHEAINKKTTCLYHMASETNRCNNLVTVVCDSFTSMENFDILDYIGLHELSEIPKSTNKVCFTHVRGEIEPHVFWEINPELFNEYDLVVCGDLHSHKNTQGKFVYPGSPFSVSYHKSIPKDTWGLLLIDTKNLSYNFIDLAAKFPQMLNKSIENPEEAVVDPYHLVTYTIEGDVVSLGKLDNNKLITKKVNLGLSHKATLDLEELDISEQMYKFLVEIRSLPLEKIQVLMRFFNAYTKKTDI